MTTIDIVDATGAKSGSVELPPEIFDTQVNIPLIHQVVVAQLAAARQGTHNTKTRAEVAGGGRKPYRQKGTGRARQGSIRSPQFVGGGVVHGPTPHDYVQRTPKKMKAAALRGALSDRAREGRVHVVDGLVEGDRPSTKSALAAVANLTSRPRVLLVLERGDEIVRLSLRNVDTIHLIDVDQLNTYDVLRSDDVVFTKGAFEALVAGPPAGKTAKAVATSTEAAADTRAAASAEPVVPADTGAAASAETAASADTATGATPETEASTETAAPDETAAQATEKEAST